MPAVPVVAVRLDNEFGYVEINESDFDAAKHERLSAEEVAALIAEGPRHGRAPTDPLDHDTDGHRGGRLSKAEIIEDLTRLEIEHDPAASWKELNALLREGKADREAAINERAEAERGGE